MPPFYPPQTPPPPGTLFDYIVQIPYFLSDIVIPFLLGLAFVIFVINVIRYFVFEGDSEDGQKKAKAQAMYSVGAFVIIIIFWGIVTMLTYSLNMYGERIPCPDYLRNMPANPCQNYQ